MNIKNIIKFTFLSISLIFFSCGTEEEVVPDSLTISADATQVFTGNAITFSAISQNNGSVTSTAQFFVNGNAIDGNAFTPTEENDTNQVYATWNDLTSNTITFRSVEEVVIPQTYTQKALFEDYTGTWCGWCPGMINVLEHFTDYSPNVIPVAIHCDDDPYRFEFQNLLQEEYQTVGLPQARINRVHRMNLFTENFITDYCGKNAEYYQGLIQPYLDQTAPLGLGINSTLNGNNLNFEIKVGFLVDQIQNAKLVVYLLEDGLQYQQTNYFAGNGDSECNYSSFPQYIPNFEHEHVLRKTYTDVFGDAIPSESLVANGIYTRNFEVTLPSEIENSNNLSLVAFVMGNENNEVINVQYAHVGEEKDFD